jgi:glycosyltransferase involved in cell wall biosynthesis
MNASVILPAHDEAATIAAVVEACARSSPEVREVVVVDDGSTDETGAIARSAGARVVELPDNRGKGHALRAGVDAAEGDVLVFLDADGQDDPAEIPALLAALSDGTDLVLGSRFLGRFEPRAITAIDRAGTRALTGVMNLLFRSRVTDPIAGFRAVRRDAFERARTRAAGYDIEVDLVLGVLRNGGRVVEVPVRRAPRRHGASDLSSVKDGTRMLLQILRHRVGR